MTQALQRALQPADIIPASAELVRVSKRLDQLNQAMDADDIDPKHWDMLTRAYDRVFKAWMVLSGTPGSGQRKPAPMRTARTQSYPSPEVIPEPIAIEAQVSPAPVQPMMVRPSAGCGPVQPVQDIKSCASAPTPPTNTGQTPA
jgi:hypothetical protein